MKQAVRILLVLASLAYGTVGLCSAAMACSCVAQSDEEYFAAASAVFIGVPVAVESTDERVLWTFEVQEVTKGRVHELQTVEVQAFDARDCNFTFDMHDRYQVFAFEHDEALATGTCSGTRSLAIAEAVKPNRGKPPVPVADEPAPARTASPGPDVEKRRETPEPDATEAEEPEVASADDSGQDGRWPVLVLAGAGLAALAASSLLLRRRRAGGRPPG